MDRENDVGEGQAKLRWGVEQRLEFIEFRLFWEGHVNRIDVIKQFGVSRNQASADLNHYIALAPNNMVYDRSARTYVRGNVFACHFREPDAAHYLSQLRLVADNVMDQEDCWIPVLPPYASAPAPVRGVDLNRPGFTGGQNSRRIARYGTESKEDLKAVFT